MNPAAFMAYTTQFENGNEEDSNGDKRRSLRGRRVSGGIVDRVTQFENLALKSPSRPITPPNQHVTGMYNQSVMGDCFKLT